MRIRYRNAMARPIDTTSCAIRPVRRRRSGLQTSVLLSQPMTTPTMIARIVAGIRWMPNLTLKTQAATAPSVTNSPCAKFVRPVVPKIRLRPTPAMAMIRPNRKPSTMVRINVSANATFDPDRASPNEKITVLGWPGATSRLTVDCTVTSSGRLSPTTSKTYVPGGTASSQRPPSADSVSPTTSPDASDARTVTPSSRSPALLSVPRTVTASSAIGGASAGGAVVPVGEGSGGSWAAAVPAPITRPKTAARSNSTIWIPDAHRRLRSLTVGATQVLPNQVQCCRARRLGRCREWAL